MVTLSAFSRRLYSGEKAMDVTLAAGEGATAHGGSLGPSKG
jgi:hypothetical protein